MALIRTDYGLIYNTDGSLCATLLPEGGVAVTEGTTNGIQNGNFATGDFAGWTDWNPANGQKSIVIRDGINYAKIKFISGTGGYGVQSTKNVSVKSGDKVTVSFRLRGEKPNYAYLMFSVGENINISSFIQYTDLLNGEYLGEYTWTSDRAADVGFLFGYSGTPKSGEFTYAQLEKKPFRTPFVNGTRPAGQLSIPLIKEQHSAGNITLSTTITCNGDDYYVDVNAILRVINTEANNAGFYILGTGLIGSNKLKLSYMLNGQLADLYMGISAKNGIKQKLTLVVDRREVYLYQDGSLLWSGTIPEWGTAVSFNRVQFLGVKSQTYENTLISPSVVSPETIKTWHSLDAPFFDPREISVVEAQANEAKQAAEDAQSAADTANSLLADIASDSKLTPDEKQATKKEWDIIVGEKPVIEAQATTYGITTEKTAYTMAYNALYGYITPLLTDLTTTSSITTGSIFRSKFKDYYDAKTALLKKISDAAKSEIDTKAANDLTSGGQILLHYGKLTGYGHTVYDGYGNKAVFSGVDPESADRGYKVYDANGSDEVTFLGVRADGRRGLMMQDGDMTWLDPGGISGSKVMSLPWASLDSATHLLFGGLFAGNFIMADENGEYGFNFGEGASQIKSYVLKATEDAYVSSLEYTEYGGPYSQRDVNYGSAKELKIARNAEYYHTISRPKYDMYTYIKFSGLSSIPGTEEIVDAEMRLYFTGLSATRFRLAVPTVTWSETTITYNNRPDYYSYFVPFDAKLGLTIIRKASLIGALDFIRAYGWENHGFRIQALDEGWEESELYSREGHSTLCPTLIVYTRESQTPIPGLSLHIPGGRVFLNRKIFDVSGKTLTLSASRNDITLYVYENEDGEAVIDFAHGGRAFKADSYIALGSATTSSSAITGTSKERNTGRKEGPPGMGNDVFSFGYTGDGIDPITISNTVRSPFVDHLLGGKNYQITLEIKPMVTGADWQIFSPVTYADGTNHRGITVSIDSTKLQFEAGTNSVYRYIKPDGTSSDVTSAAIRGKIVRLD